MHKLAASIALLGFLTACGGDGNGNGNGDGATSQSPATSVIPPSPAPAGPSAASESAEPAPPTAADPDPAPPATVVSDSTPCSGEDQLAPDPGLPNAAAVRALLRNDRPRLLVTGPELGALSRRAERLRWLYEDARSRTAGLMAKPQLASLTSKPLEMSRKMLDLTVGLGVVHLVERENGRPSMAEVEHLRSELRTAARMPQWDDPKAGLAYGQMGAAVGLAYDWLYEHLSEAERAEIRAALLRNAIVPLWRAYTERASQANTTWSSNNWGMIVNGGVLVAALSIASEDTTSCSFKVIAGALGRVKKTLGLYAPEGAWFEGPVYWSFAGRYTAMALRASQTALGQDFGLTRQPGLHETGRFRMHLLGPTRRMFNFSDAQEASTTSPLNFFLATQHRDRRLAEFEFSKGLGGTLERLLYLDESVLDLPIKDEPADGLFRGDGIEVAFLRSASPQSNDANAAYLAIKGGTNPPVSRGHRQLDLGSFVFDALGERWFMELGGNDYVPGYFNDKRFLFYRARTEGQNTLVVHPDAQQPLRFADQRLGAAAPIVAFSSGERRSFAVLDLTAAYPDADSVLRGVALLDKSHVVLQDEVRAARPVQVLSLLHTNAAVVATGRDALLSKNGKLLRVRIVSPSTARFVPVSADPLSRTDGPALETPNPGVTNLTVQLDSKVTQARIVVHMKPQGSEQAVYAVSTLSEWIGGASGR